MLTCGVHAQTTQPTTTAAPAKKVGDYIESFTNNVPTGRVAREMQYTPQDGDFYCLNGKNRFTRALYGSNSDYRIETSDKPIFAIYKGKNYKSLRYYVNDVELSDVERCEARYGKGRRAYVMTDKRWGTTATVRLECVAMHDKEGCYWYFTAEGFGGKAVTLTSKMCDIAITRLSRNGDLGADKPGCFDPSPTEANLETETCTFKEKAMAVVTLEPAKEEGAKAIHTLRLEELSGAVGVAKTKDKVAAAVDNNTYNGYVMSKRYFEEMAERVVFKTPEPWLNTLGSTLTLAADGAWDGETWLHGAIGWRMPLAGWRAGYLGDVLGWNDRAVSHFDAYAASQVTDVEPTIASPSQDAEMNMARAEKKWGTQMYSNGYICRNPNRNNQMHHYDMNLNYVDELLWHFQYDADVEYMKKMWPVLTRHLAWEKRNFDKDNNHLYDAYCCIWASDALYYNGGEVTHSTAYNYRGNLLAAKIARMIGEDPSPYQQEADAILKAMNESLWVEKGADETGGLSAHWAEYKDVMGLQRVHPDAALWSVYTPIDCGVGTPEQMYSCTKYVDENIPHIAVEIANGKETAGSIVSTSNWLPYSWSINNVASAEIMHTALAMFEAGRAEKGMALVKANVYDQMYLGASPGNLGQISYYDAARGESYRDFGDNIGISARAIVQGVFGIVPQALDGECVIRPGFPMEWKEAEVKTPYLTYIYKREGERAVFTVEQHFKSPLRIRIRINTEDGRYVDYVGDANETQQIWVDIPQQKAEEKPMVRKAQWDGYTPKMLGLERAGDATKQTQVAVEFNANVTDIFRNEYLSPRPQSTSLEIPVQGIGEWCHPKFTVEINDSAFRTAAVGDEITIDGVRFATPQKGRNILFASLWDNYPDEVAISLRKGCKGKEACFLIAGSTNHMQTRMENARITAEYTDGTKEVLPLVPPFNYCPIEQDYYVDGKAFNTMTPRPVRVSLGTAQYSDDLGTTLNIPADEVYGREIKGGAAQVLRMPLDPKKKVKQFRLTCLSNDIVVGIMAVTVK